MATVETPTTEVRAEARWVRSAPRKAQLVVREIRGLPVGEALTALSFMTRAAARDVESVLKSAIANAEANHDLDADKLYVSAAYVGAGPTLKRWKARARGRVGRIRKRTCHITVRVAPIQGAAMPEPPSASRPRRAVKSREAGETPVEVPASEAPVAEAGEAPGTEPEARPKRASRARKTEQEGAAEPSAGERPKLARSRRPRAEEAAPEPAEETAPLAETEASSAGEEKPRRARSRKKSADETAEEEK